MLLEDLLDCKIDQNDTVVMRVWCQFQHRHLFRLMEQNIEFRKRSIHMYQLTFGKMPRQFNQEHIGFPMHGARITRHPKEKKKKRKERKSKNKANKEKLKPYIILYILLLNGSQVKCKSQTLKCIILIIRMYIIIKHYSLTQKNLHKLRVILDRTDRTLTIKEIANLYFTKLKIITMKRQPQTGRNIGKKYLISVHFQNI